ncbi:hypothetical protein [Halobacteriovorax sp. HLS]|uniref:hypothetical protein n=1 Tax=Halobacteriovorax sp. HLS TaxID=2234000 RepID=UPI000FDC9324|nr:hypothetical protein [Halobacteriovorax sp. HLS]
MKLITILLLFSINSYSQTIHCKDIKERSLQVNEQVTIRIDNFSDVCSFTIETSRDSKVSPYSQSRQDASRQWSFQSKGKINVLSNYGTGPTDSSSSGYKSYQLFPNDKGLSITKNQDGTFSMALANGAKVHFSKNGSIDTRKTTDLKIKDRPIELPTIPKSKSSYQYEKLDALDYRDPKKVSIRVYHRGLYTSAISRSIGLETNIGMYIPLGIEMGKLPGSNSNSSYTLFGKDDEKLCSSKMPASYFFNYIVKCSTRTPNSQCPCSLSEEEISSRLNTNYALEGEIRKLKNRLRSVQGDERFPIEKEIERLELKYDSKLYSKLYSSCALDKDDANSFVADRRRSGDHREIDGLQVKTSSQVMDKLINSGKCAKLKSLSENCIHCGLESLINLEMIDIQKKNLDKIIKEIE